MNKPRIAFLGLGIMGSGMARRLLGHGFPLVVFNRDAKKIATFAAEGAQAAGSPREAATHADLVSASWPMTSLHARFGWARTARSPAPGPAWCASNAAP